MKICWLYFYPGYLQIITMEFLKFPIPSIFAPFLRSRKNRWQHIYIYGYDFEIHPKKSTPILTRGTKEIDLKKRIFDWEEFDIMRKFYCLNCLWKDSFEKYLNCNHIKEQLTFERNVITYSFIEILILLKCPMLTKFFKPLFWMLKWYEQM